MRKTIGAVSLVLLLTACSRNEPGTMGGANAPATVATGAAADAAKTSVVSIPQQSSLKSEHASATFDDSTLKANVTAPDASTRPAPVTPPVPH